MNFNRITIWVTLISLVALVIAAFLTWFFFFRSTAAVSTDGTASSSLFGGSPNTTNTTPANTDTNGTQAVNTTASAMAQKIFKISDGPVAGATLLQTMHPTTTIARYIRQDDGHVFDVPLGVSGVLPRVVSNITIPGGQRAIWLEGGNAALMQYVDDTGIIKTVYLGFPQATTTRSTLPTRIQFLPDNIIDIAGSPDGKSLAYLIKTVGGSDGYLARSDGANSKKTFSLPLSQMLLSWPSQDTLLANTKSAAGITGIAFSIDVKSGNVSPLVSAPGLSSTADHSFSQLVYKKLDGISNSTYAHDIKNGTNISLSFSPIPEKCTWSMLKSIMYCASPVQYVSATYLDLWHQGKASAADGIFFYNFTNGTNAIIASPGSGDGGIPSDILEMALSPDEHYLSYTVKGSRTLWGVLLGN